MFGFIKRLRRRFCKHAWIQAAEYWHNKTGKDYKHLTPTPMKYHPGYQANCYVCSKCGKSIITIEKTES